MVHSLIPLLVIVLAGSLAAIQAPMNAALGASLGSGTLAAAISFGIGFIVLLAIVVLTGDAGHFANAGTVNRWLFLGGFLGAFYVWAILWAIPTLGVVTAISAMIFGQMIVALVLDSTGLFGLQVTQISPQRLLAAALVVGGVVLSKV